MNWHEDMAGDSPEIEQALKHFKASMDAWSYMVSNDAARSLPRTLTRTDARRSWRPAASWALGCLLATGSLTVAVRQIVGREAIAGQTAQMAAQKAAEERAAAERIGARAQNRAAAFATVRHEASAEDEDLLASVDHDVSQQVPAAMEPLAQLMDENGTQ